jgi:hypothetical protein
MRDALSIHFSRALLSLGSLGHGSSRLRLRIISSSCSRGRSASKSCVASYIYFRHWFTCLQVVLIFSNPIEVTIQHLQFENPMRRYRRDERSGIRLSVTYRARVQWPSVQ